MVVFYLLPQGDVVTMETSIKMARAGNRCYVRGVGVRTALSTVIHTYVQHFTASL